MTKLVLSILGAAALAACGDDGGGNDSKIPDACNPLGGEGCLMPWPSQTYLTADSSRASGFKLDIPLAAMPTNIDHATLDPAQLARLDGFSPTGPMLAMFPNGVSSAGLPSFKTPDDSLAASSPIVLLDLDTGERAPFFAEVDQNQTVDADRALIIRPLARLHEKSHYAVAIRNTVMDAAGAPLVASPGFAALRDGTSFSHPRFADMASRAEAMFGKLESAGVPRADLVLAWDFTTASDASLQSDLTTMRTAALPAIGTNGANLSFVAHEQTNTPLTYKRYTGTFKSPNFLTNGNQPDSIMHRDGNGKPMLSGTRDANFAAVIPRCVEVEGMPLPRPVIVFGHGLFGSSASYLDDDFVQNLAEEKCFIIIAGDFIGLTHDDLATVTTAVNDLNKGPRITDKLGQSVIDFIALEQIARGPMKDAPEFKIGVLQLIDPTKVYYVGGSLGGIMGNTIMAYDPNFERGVLAVPGGVWSMLFERSAAWALLMPAAQGAYPDRGYYQLNLAFLGMGMEPFDPITTAAHVIKDPLFGQAPKKILMWYSIGDCLVNNLTTEMVARTMGIDVLAPSVKSPWGLDPMAGPMDSGVIVFDDHPTPLPPESNIPPITDNGTHSGINKKPAALRAVEAFLLDPQEAEVSCMVSGNIAKCDCMTGACN